MTLLNDITEPEITGHVLFQYQPKYYHPARLAQSVEHETLNLRVVGSSPTLGAILLLLG